MLYAFGACALVLVNLFAVKVVAKYGGPTSRHTEGWKTVALSLQCMSLYGLYVVAAAYVSRTLESGRVGFWIGAVGSVGGIYGAWKLVEGARILAEAWRRPR